MLPTNLSRGAGMVRSNRTCCTGATVGSLVTLDYCTIEMRRGRDSSDAACGPDLAPECGFSAFWPCSSTFRFPGFASAVQLHSDLSHLPRLCMNSVRRTVGRRLRQVLVQRYLIASSDECLAQRAVLSPVALVVDPHLMKLPAIVSGSGDTVSQHVRLRKSRTHDE